MLVVFRVVHWCIRSFIMFLHPLLPPPTNKETYKCPGCENSHQFSINERYLNKQLCFTTKSMADLQKVVIFVEGTTGFCKADQKSLLRQCLVYS